ncbi:hypothetical protein BH10PSE17_BH10PSE17_13450 [soil metagenome]
MNNALRFAAVLAIAASALFGTAAHAAEGRTVMSVGAVVIGAPCLADSASVQAVSNKQCAAVRVQHIADAASTMVADASRATAVANAQVVEYVY